MRLSGQQVSGSTVREYLSDVLAATVHALIASLTNCRAVSCHEDGLLPVGEIAQNGETLRAGSVFAGVLALHCAKIPQASGELDKLEPS